MTAVPGPDPDELRLLIEGRLGPLRAAEIEAHVAASSPCKQRLERLTVRRAWDREDRTTREAGSLDGQAPNAAETEAVGGTTNLKPADVHAADRKYVGLSSPTRIGFRCRSRLLPAIGPDRGQEPLPTEDRVGSDRTESGRTT